MIQKMCSIFFLCFLCFKPTILLSATGKYLTNTSYPTIWNTSEGKIVVEKDVDLRGTVCILPKDILLTFKGGVIRNGTLIGNNTELDWRGGVIFDNVKIDGSWKVQKISTEMFTDLSYNNGLKILFVLASPSIKNDILIDNGKYTVSATKKENKCLIIPSNTRLMVKGEIRMKPNNLQRYSILYAEGENIEICGGGIIVGDKFSHTGTEGEWGMGINSHKAKNVSFSGLTIRDCWGDCIYVGGNSKNILIENCTLDNGRRQGISVTKADSVTIQRCSISNVGGTAPGYAIDIEPNTGDTVDHVLIEKVVVKNCHGGVKATRSLKQSTEGKPLSWIGSVAVRYCDISAQIKFPALFKGCYSLLLSNCKIISAHAKPAIRAKSVSQVRIVENIIIDEDDLFSKAKRYAKKIFQREGTELISIEGAKSQTVKANKIINEYNR